MPGVSTTTRGAGPGGVRVRRLARGADDGYRSGLVPGLKSSQEAERLAEELAFATTRLTRLATAPPGLYAELADPQTDLAVVQIQGRHRQRARAARGADCHAGCVSALGRTVPRPRRDSSHAT